MWYVILYNKNIPTHISAINTTTCMSSQSGGFLPLGIEGQMISPTALIPQGSSTVLHFSPFSTAPADKRSVLPCQSAKFKFRDREKEKCQ